MQKRLFRMCLKGPRLHGPSAAFRMKVSFQLSDSFRSLFFFSSDLQVKINLIQLLKYISQDAGLYNQKANVYVLKITLLGTIHSDSSQCEIYEKLNFWPE